MSNAEQSSTTHDLVGLLREAYTDADAFKWLTLPHPQFDGATALDVIAGGRAHEVIMSLRQMLEGVYL